MAQNLSITSLHDKAEIGLHGDMSVSFNQAVTANFSVRLFTATNETFTLNSNIYKFLNLAGQQVSSLQIGGAVGAFADLMFDPDSQVWYITGNNLLQGAGDTVKEVKFNDSKLITVDSLDAALGNCFTITLTDNFVVPVIKNAKAGVTYTFLLVQDADGERGVTFDKHYKFSNNTAPSVSIAGSTIDLCRATYSSNGFFYCEYKGGYTIIPIARIGTDKYDSMADAIAASVDNDTIYVTRSGQMAECVGSLRKDINLTIAGDYTLKTIPTLHVDGTITLAGQKGIINPEAGNITVRDLKLDGAATFDLSGSGVRGNPGQRHMRIERVTLTNNQNGMLVGAPSAANTLTSGFNLEMIDCTFDRNGQGNDSQSHNIYLNHRVRAYALRSTYTNAVYGHDFKTRAAFVLLDRTYHRGAMIARELDVPNGGIIHAVNCSFIKDAGATQGNLIGIGQEGVDNVEEYIFRNCLFQNDQGNNFSETWFYHQNSSVPIKFIDCVFIGPARCVNVGPFELYYTNGPIGPEGWDQSNRGVIPKQGTSDGTAGSIAFPDNQQPQPVYGPDPTLTIFPPTGSTATPSIRPENVGPDTVSPTVSLSSSLTNVSAVGNITLTANATDNVGVTKVEFYREGVLIGTDTAPAYTQTVALSDSDNGTINFTAKAYDAANHVTTSNTVTVTVNILPPPAVYPFSMDNVTTNEYNTAIDAAPAGTKRMAAANTVVAAFGSDYFLNIYQVNTLVVSAEFLTSMVTADDGTNVSVSTGQAEPTDPLVNADINAGTWHFELVSNVNANRIIKGSVGPSGSGKMIELSDSPAPGTGINISLKLVVPRSVDGLS